MTTGEQFEFEVENDDGVPTVWVNDAEGGTEHYTFETMAAAAEWADTQREIQRVDEELS